MGTDVQSTGVCDFQFHGNLPCRCKSCFPRCVRSHSQLLRYRCASVKRSTFIRLAVGALAASFIPAAPRRCGFASLLFLAQATVVSHFTMYKQYNLRVPFWHPVCMV